MERGRKTEDTLKVELDDVKTIIVDDGTETCIMQHREQMIAAVSQCQDIMDQVLQYGAIPTVDDSAVLLPES